MNLSKNLSQKKTTDDCYTPPAVYDAVAEWVAREYGLNKENFVRPFYPGGDYERFPYAEECIVVDNPPFSILTKICNFYIKNGIKFFLFAPTLTLLSGQCDVSYVCVGAQIIYENGANVNTSFVTNLDSCRLRTAPGLYGAIEGATTRDTAQIPKYTYPANILTAAAICGYNKHGIEFVVQKGECYSVRALDAQRPHKKNYFWWRSAGVR